MFHFRKAYFTVLIMSLVLALSSFVVAYETPSLTDLHEKLQVKTPLLAGTAPELAEEISLLSTQNQSFLGFKEKLAYRESRGRYHVVNRFGYAGKYQFGTRALALFGVSNKQDFINDPELQERVFLHSLSYNKWLLRKEIAQYSGRRFGKVLITESGILAAAHLAGVSSVKKYLASYGKNQFRDGNGTSITHYMKSFSGYNLSQIKADKNAPALLRNTLSS